MPDRTPFPGSEYFTISPIIKKLYIQFDKMTCAGLSAVFKGTFVHATATLPMCILEEHILGVDSTGKIAFLEPAEKQDELSIEWDFECSDIRELGEGEFFMPGFVDTHIHASQYSFSGTALDLPLLDWLNKYTFPVEAKFDDLSFAKDVYTKVVKRTLKNGTTTACYFATIHTDSSLLLADITNTFGQRALVGKVCMDFNIAHQKYKETPRESVEETQRFIDELQNKQSHISESLKETEAVKMLFCGFQNYSDVYDKHRLLTDKTVMAHGCHLSNEELQLFKCRGAAISHCPNSNISLISGVLDVRNVLNHGVKIGLGTDAAAGYSHSMLDAIRRAIDTSKYISMHDSSYKTLSYKEVFRLATLGGSEALGLQNTIGNFEVEKEFDALLISPVSDGPFDVFDSDSNEDVVQKFINLGDDRNIKEVYVAGKKVIPFPRFEV
ncbi:guanine deaminase isoform X2 [Protopterus annectens]|uniref:guanine deaminase isoform X2 n=1 Tax=Protopterus annectens TaxID=7888 RepID=UPI001CFB5DAE|nr:guanine deaminase isoform X2 [Protopterus annectens]